MNIGSLPLEEAALEKASKKYNVEKSRITLSQDADVLYTWFSSALLSFLVFEWPDKSAEELNYLFPTNLLKIGHDIILWVARKNKLLDAKI